VTFALRLVVILLAAFGFLNIIGSIALAVLWRPPVGSADMRARALFHARMTPTIGALVATVLAACAFVRFEPSGTDERIGWMLTLFALVALGVLVRTSIRLVRAERATRQSVRAWMTSAVTTRLDGIDVPVHVVSTTFPIVAIVGLFRPRLVIARSVLERCHRDEMKAILAHESWHLHRHDNIRRAVFSAAPDVLGWLPLSRRLRELWQIAAEESADDAAARTGPAGRVQLAEALVRVARLDAEHRPECSLPATALYRGESIEQRVRRMLDPTLDLRAGPGNGLIFALVALVLVVSLLNLGPIQDLVEIAVNYLP